MSGRLVQEWEKVAMVSGIRRPRKVFTLREANSTLPLVSRILRDVVQCHKEMEKLNEVLTDSSDPTEVDVLRGRVQGKEAEISGYLKELHTIGCECKDYKLGLVDFPAQLDERIVYLCWRLGEEEISHWHEIEAGFPGRQTVAGVFT